MLRIACFFTGDDFKNVLIDTPYSRKKIVTLAIALMIPTILWLSSGFMLAYQVLQAGIGCAIIVALFCGSVVFMIEKLVIMAKGNRWLTIFRTVIGFIVGALGSLAIDEVVFKEDINSKIPIVKMESVESARRQSNSEFDNQNNRVREMLSSDIKMASFKYDNALREANLEAEGKKHTGKGWGPIATHKYNIAMQLKEDRNGLIYKNDSLLIARENHGNEAALEIKRTFHEDALLNRIRALFKLVASDRIMLVTYILFFMLMFLFEMLVVILKCLLPKSNYEEKLERIEEIGKKRMERLLNVGSELLEPGNYSPNFKRAKGLLEKRSSIFSN